MLIKKYTSKWVKDFTDLKREIEKGFSGIAYSIEHIGSTSIQDLDSKPIIDIDIIYFNREDFGKIKMGLEKIGYFHNGNQGINDREVFKRTRNLYNGILDNITHHLYVCPTNSKAMEKHILFRDFLRKNSWARLAYQQLKYELANEANQDKTKYAELKEQKANEFIDQIIEIEKNERPT